MKNALLLLLLSIVTVAVQSQPLMIDSLRNELKTAKEDTNKVILYRMLAGIVGKHLSAGSPD